MKSDIFETLDIVIKEEIEKGIKVVTLHGEVKEHDRERVIDALFEKYGIIEGRHLQRYCLEMRWAYLMDSGTDRSPFSPYRDLEFENDFSAHPEDYTYCHHRNDLMRSWAQNLFQAEEVTHEGRQFVYPNVCMFYLAEKLTQHPNYDCQSGFLFSFNDPDHKKDALHVVFRYYPGNHPEGSRVIRFLPKIALDHISAMAAMRIENK